MFNGSLSRIGWAAPVAILGMTSCTFAASPSQTPAPTAIATPSTAAYVPRPLNPTVTLKVGDGQFNPEAPVYIALDQGYFKDEGLEVQLVPTGGPNLAAVMLGTRQIDFSMIGPDPSIFNAMASGIEIRIVASAVRNLENDRTGQVIVRSDLLDSGAYTGPADLKGASIGVTGDQSQFFIERFLARAGLSGQDVRFVQLGLQDILPALQGKAIAAAWEVEPLATIAANQGLAKPVATTGELLPGNIGNALLMAPDFAQQQPEAAQHFVIAYMRGLRAYYHAFNKQDADRSVVVQSLVRHTPSKDPKLFDVIGMQTVDPNGGMDTTSWNAFQDYFLERGDQRQKIDLMHYVDMQLLNAALDSLGREP